MPLFPDETCANVTRSSFVTHIEAGFHLLNIETVSHTGSCLAGEDSYGNGIAQFLASQRVEVLLIQRLLRHSCNSQTILTYIREAHIAAASDLSEQVRLARALGTVRSELRSLQHKATSLKSM